MCLFFIFFFKQKTAYEMRSSDWSSDVCSSDLLERARALALSAQAAPTPGLRSAAAADLSPLARLEASCEALRVTSRLAHCLAWVLIHKIGRTSCWERVCQYV